MPSFTYTNMDFKYMDNDIVSVKKHGRCCRMVSSQHHSTKEKIKRIGIHQYLRCSDGTINDIKDHKHRSTNTSACRDLNDIILGNCDAEKSVFTSVTYAENLESFERIVANHKNFIRRLNKEFDERFNYIAVVELQKCGNPHLHYIFMFQTEINYNFTTIQDIIDRCWSFGDVLTKEVYDVNGLAHYLTKDYKNKEAMEIFPKNKKKYYTSRGLGQCETISMLGAEANKLKEEQMETVSSKYITIKDDETGYYDEMYQVVGLLK